MRKALAAPAAALTLLLAAGPARAGELTLAEAFALSPTRGDEGAKACDERERKTQADTSRKTRMHARAARFPRGLTLHHHAQVQAPRKGLLDAPEGRVRETRSTQPARAYCRPKWVSKR